MSGLRAKHEAMKRYMTLANTIGYKPKNVNLRSMNAQQINKAYTRLEKAQIKKQNIKQVQYPPRPEMWNFMKSNNLTKRRKYSDMSAEDMYNVVAKRTDTFQPRKRVNRHGTIEVRNPVNGGVLDREGINMFMKLGYVINGSQMIVPSTAYTVEPVINSNGDTIYPIGKSILNSYSSGCVFYRIVDKNGLPASTESVKLGNSLDSIISEGFRINPNNRMTVSNAINDIRYRYKLGTDRTIEIVKVELYKAQVKQDDGNYRYGSEFGVAYRELVSKNCVISAIEQHLKKDLSDLHYSYRKGVAPTDYEDIAKALRIVIKLSVGNKVYIYNEQSKRRVVHLTYLNNHCIASYDRNELKVVKKPNLSNATIDEIFEQESINSITNLIKINDKIIYLETESTKYQLDRQTYNDHEVMIQGDSITATTEYKKAFIQMNHLVPTNHADARNLCRHGIKILKQNYAEGYTLDLRKAYNSYDKWNCYEGMPLDLTFWVDHEDQHLDTILANYAGFGYVSWKSYFLDTPETRWASIPHIKSRLKKGHQITFHKWALSFRKGDLDMSLFDGTYKRVWQHVLGSLSRYETIQSLATTDPILAKERGLGAHRYIKDVKVFYGEIDREYTQTYAYIPAYVQCYTEIMIEDMFDRVKHMDWWGVYVDGISFKCDPDDIEEFVNEWWDIKPNVRFTAFTAICDSSYTYSGTHGEYNTFADIGVYGASRFKIIDGPAGSGKSTHLKKIQTMTGATILVQNNLQRQIYLDDGFEAMTVDMYLTMAFSRGNKGIDKFVLIDEYYQMEPEKLLKFNMALLYGNKDQLALSENTINYKDYDHLILKNIYRYNAQLADVANKVLNNGDVSGVETIDIKEALLNNWNIIAPTHKVIEKINDIGLSMNLPRKIRFTKTDLKRDIWANDLGLFENGVCKNLRNGKVYKLTPERIIDDKPLVVYAYARTYHSTQGQTMSKVCCVRNGASKSMLYTGITRARDLENVRLCIA